MLFEFFRRKKKLVRQKKNIYTRNTKQTLQIKKKSKESNSRWRSKRKRFDKH